MRDWGKSLWLLGAASVFLFCAPLSVHAAVVYSQIANEATTTDATLAFFKIPAGTGVPGGVKSIDLIASSNGVGHGFRAAVICRRFSNYTGNCPEMPDFSITTDSTSTAKTAKPYHLPFTSGNSVALTPDRFYAFGIQRMSGDAAGINLRGVTTTNICVITGCGLSGSPYVVLEDGIPDEPDVPDPVIIIPGILGSEKNSDGEWVIDPILHTYDDLIATLDINHYTLGVDLFPFPYNWRNSNVETALLLKQKIDEVKAICNCDKVDLVAHSMGGLVARQYIQSDTYDDDVDQLIFLGTPHLGAPKAYLMWEGGITGSDWQDAPMNFLLSQEAEEEGFSDVFSYVQGTPILSVQQLLPVYDFIFDSSGLRNYPMDYPANPFLESLNGEINKLFDSGVRVYNFTGNTSNQETIVGINVISTNALLPKWEHGVPDEESTPFVYGSGDGTVAIPSATYINSNLKVHDSNHRVLVTAAEGDIYEILTNDPATTLVNNPDTINFKLLLIKILSPADLLVKAPDGSMIGKQDDQVVNEIPNAFYSGFNTATEFITILNPLDGEYKVITEGTNTGSYTVEVAYVSEEDVVETSFTGNTSPGLVNELNVFLDNENPGSIGVAPTDLEPPVVTIANPESKDYLRSEQMPVEVTADDLSGIFALETKLGTTTIPNVGTIDLFFQKLGTHTIAASSSDNVNNATSTMRTFRITANATSTLSDIGRAYAEGWISAPSRDLFTKKIKACYVQKKTVVSTTKTVVVTGRNGKPTSKVVTEKKEVVEIVFDKNCAKAILKELDKYRGRGINEQAYQLLREDIQWIVNN